MTRTWQRLTALVSAVVLTATLFAPAIAGSLRFDGVDDRVKWTTLQSALSNIPTGSYTIAFLFKRAAVSNFDALGYLLSSTGNGVAEIGISLDDIGNNPLIDNGSAAKFDDTAFTSTTSPYLFVISKAAGTATPRLGWKLGSGGSWTHEDANNSDVNQTAATMLEIGAWQNGDFCNCWIGLVAIWSGAMSDANKEKLDDNWRTSDFYNTDVTGHGSKPVFLAQFNVAGASVVDLIGNATSITVTGTTLDAAETLDSWNFDGTGSAPAVVPRRGLLGVGRRRRYACRAHGVRLKEAA